MPPNCNRPLVRLAMNAAALAAGLGVMAMLYAFNPAESRLFPPCPFHALTGWQCPGCGSLRALHQLLHGHPEAAFRLNPLMVLSVPFVAGGLLAELWSRMSQKPLVVVRLPAWGIRAILAVIILFGVLRNLPL